ncbi:hypothetical protein Q1695_009767 [Nippostrongylus brasiliensis]|nr:hypothetical protein Q1695_009767 [Nippostrongylus brasiliensis]
MVQVWRVILQNVKPDAGLEPATARLRVWVDVQNPYAEVFGGSSTIPRCTTQRTSSSKSSLLTGYVTRNNAIRQNHLHPQVGCYVTQGSIIPRANTPSAMSRTNF